MSQRPLHNWEENFQFIGTSGTLGGSTVVSRGESEADGQAQPFGVFLSCYFAWSHDHVTSSCDLCAFLVDVLVFLGGNKLPPLHPTFEALEGSEGGIEVTAGRVQVFSHETLPALFSLQVSGN